MSGNSFGIIFFSVPELKQALKHLQAQHPEAYDEFVRTLYPGARSMAVLKPSEVCSFSVDNEFTSALCEGCLGGERQTIANVH